MAESTWWVAWLGNKTVVAAIVGLLSAGGSGYLSSERGAKIGAAYATEKQVRVIAESSAACVDEHRYTCWACAVLPDHVPVICVSVHNPASVSAW